MTAIIYTSNTGYTKQYAEMLSEKTGVPCYDAEEAKMWVIGGADIIYLGWLMAGTISGYKSAAKRYNVKAVCAVGMDNGESQKERVKASNKTGETPLFMLKGGFDMSRLNAVHKLMMKAFIKTYGEKLAKKPNPTKDEKDSLDLMKNGGSRVSEKNLAPVIKWFEGLKN